MPAATIILPLNPASYDAALEGLTSLNEGILSGYDVPPLYASGARYKTEPNELWRHAGLVAGEGWGDCEDLAAYRAAECRVSGEDPDAHVHTYVTGPRRLHAIVMHGDGSIEDPSLALGMQPHHPNARVIDDPLAGLDDVTWDRDVSGGFRLRVPMRPAPGRDKALMVRMRFQRPPHFGRRGVLGGDDLADVAGVWGGVLRVTRAVLSTPEARALLPAPAQLALARYGRAASIARKIASAAQGPRRPPPPAAPPPAEDEQQAIAPDEYIPPEAEAPPAETQQEGEQ